MIKNQQNPNITDEDVKQYNNLILHPAFFNALDNLIPNVSVIKILVGEHYNVNINKKSGLCELKEPYEFVIHLRSGTKVKHLIPNEIIIQHHILNSIQDYSEYLFLSYIDVIPKIFNVMVIVINKDNQFLYSNKIKSSYCTIFNC